MAEPAESGEWEYYFLEDEDHPASVMLNLEWVDAAPPAHQFHLFTVAVDFRAPGPHGMGTADDAAEIRDLEAGVVEALAAESALFVGHIRAGGAWTMFFYGRDPGVMRAAAEPLLGALAERTWTLEDRADPKWEAYHEDLYPDSERLQWIHNRKVIEALVEAGDPLVLLRRVDHYLYFERAEDRQTFLFRTSDLGFSVEELSYQEELESPYQAQIYRDDPVDLEAVHQIVMQLVEAAEELGGSYDGWETVVLERPRGQFIGPN